MFFKIINTAHGYILSVWERKDPSKPWHELHLIHECEGAICDGFNKSFSFNFTWGNSEWMKHKPKRQAMGALLKL